MRKLKYSTFLYITIAILLILLGFLICVQLFPQVFSNPIQTMDHADKIIQTVDHAIFEDLPPIMTP